MSPTLPAEIQLKSGGHTKPEQGMCLLEAVAWLADEPHSDHPPCACPVVSAVGRRLNDHFVDDAVRTRALIAFVPRLIGSKSTPQVERARRWSAVDWAIRTVVPDALERLKNKALTPHVVALRRLPDLTPASWKRAVDVVRAARDSARSAYAYAYADADADAAAAAAYAAYAAAAADARRARDARLEVLAPQILDHLLAITPETLPEWAKAI